MTSRSAATLAQGLYFLATGLWPLVHYRSFEKVTGPKRDVWLVRTVGALTVAMAIPLIRAALRRKDERTLATTSALAFGAVDLGYVAAGRISKVYLADAAVEAAFVAAHLSRR